MKPRVRCTARYSNDSPLAQMVQEAGFEALAENKGIDFRSEDVVIREVAGCSAVIAGTEPYTRRVLEALPDLRLIARVGVGLDSVDLAACDDLDIAVATTPGVNHHAVAEHTIALLMGVARGFPKQDQRVREGVWLEIPTPRIMGRTLGIVGLGRVGQAVATRAIGLGLNILAFEPHASPDFVEHWDIELVALEELLERSDYVSLHCPPTPQTRHMMNEAAFSRMKPGSFFINTARGALVNEQALIAALQSGKLRGAGLDVFEEEPLPLESPLLSLPNVLLSGHVAGLDDESRRDTIAMTIETLVALRSGKWPVPTVQNLKHVSQWSWDHPAR